MSETTQRSHQVLTDPDLSELRGKLTKLKKDISEGQRVIKEVKHRAKKASDEKRIKQIRQKISKI